MRGLLVFTLGAVLLRAAASTDPQPEPTPPNVAEDSDVQRARLALDRLRVMVAAGAVPRIQLEKAEDALGDARDMAVLRQTMGSHDLTEEAADEMVAAAQRRLDRRQKQFDRMQGLLDSGLVAKNELEGYADQVGFARRERDLAQSRARLCHDLGEMARAEQSPHSRREPGMPGGSFTAFHYGGKGTFTPAQYKQIAAAFQRRFAKPLPVSAMGETAVHRALGFDHRGRVDVAVSPDQPEGLWLRAYLETHHIPYFAFRAAVPGKATGAHIHIGPESTRLTVAARRTRSSLAD